MKSALYFSILSVLNLVLFGMQHAYACPLNVSNNKLSIQSLGDPSPSTGDQKVLMIMVDFSDEPGQFTQQSFYQQFFGTNPTGSFADYFYENSYGQLRYSGSVVGLKAGVAVENSSSIAYIRLPYTKSYYAGGNGGSNVEDFPKNVVGLTYHALQALDNAGFDFSPYADAQHIVRNAIILAAGRPFGETKNSGDLNPQNFTIDYTKGVPGGYVTKMGIILKGFSLCPERGAEGQAPIGICTHEQGHTLGLPDLYDLSYTFTADAYWDLMASGTFGGINGKRPFHLGAFSKMKLGWLTPTLPTNDGNTFNLTPVEDSPSVLKLVPSNSTNEYFLVENRQEHGFDDRLYERELCPGIVIWHIDEQGYNKYYSTNRVNTPPNDGSPFHASVSIVEYDGDGALLKAPLNYGVCADTFPQNSSWSDSTPGNAHLWDGTESGLKLFIGSRNSDGSVALNLSTTPVSSPSPTPTLPSLVGSITVRILGSTIKGQLVSEQAVDGYKVKLLSKRTRKMLATANTNAQGYFRFRNIKPGSYQIKIGPLSVDFKIKR